MRVLLIEDDESLAAALVPALKNKGHTVTLFTCLRDGVIAVTDNLTEFDAIITDVLLPVHHNSPYPDGSGLEIVRTLFLMSNPNEQPIPLYVHSSDTTDRGIDIAVWLNEKYPTGVFRKKAYADKETTRAVLSFIRQLNLK